MYKTLFPETAPKRVDTGVKRGEYKPRNPHFPSAKAIKIAEKKAAATARAAMKFNGVAPTISTKRGDSRIAM